MATSFSSSPTPSLPRRVVAPVATDTLQHRRRSRRRRLVGVGQPAQEARRQCEYVNNNNNNTSNVSSSTAFEQSPKPRAALSAPPTPAAVAAVAPAAPADDRNLKQLVEAAVQEALRGTLPHLQASMRQVDDAERRRVAALEQQLADVKQQLTRVDFNGLVDARAAECTDRSAIARRLSGAASSRRSLTQQLAEALRLSRAEAQAAEAKAVAEKLRA
jgi:hypothetical protein